MHRRRIFAAVTLVVACLVFFSGAALAVESPSSDNPPAPAASPLLIVELNAPPLAAVYRTQIQAASATGRMDVSSADAQAYIAELQAQQAAFAGQMQTVLPDATVSQFIDENGVRQNSTYQVVFNGLAVNPGNGNREAARKLLAKLPNVKAVYFDEAHTSDLYTSTLLINAPAVWDVLGGRAEAGAGVKFASMDGGVHHLSPMFNGEGYTYPNGFGPNGKGLIANNNGKIITSRAYFRSWDPPQTSDLGLSGCGDACGWPGPQGTSHGVHTASTAAGNVITDVVYNGYPVGTISGVAPHAYVMSYKVFYGSVNGDGSFYNAEGIAALEDIAMDGADVLNNSWGGGPTSNGNLGDPLETALANTAAAGVFISMSAGNAGPASATTDHPLPDYINVGATTSGGTLADGFASVPPAAPNLQTMPYGTAEFGPLIEAGQVFTYTYLPAAVVDAANTNGCSAFSAGAFTGKAALIQRGSCNFSTKARNAQTAGAVFVIIYNNLGGDAIQGMSCGDPSCDDITISTIFIGQDNGEAMVTWYNDQGASNATVVVSGDAFQLGNTPDQVSSFSSRGPGVGNVGKPDIVAPGVNILAQGYTPGATGEEQYLGYGQASGTSMASPHVAGAAVLVREAYPNWPNSAIKSALMSTAKYTEVYNFNGTPAQPLDMGAGRLDLTHVLDPGVILNPPSVSFGTVPTGTAKTLVVQVTSVTTVTESYALSTLFTGSGFTATTALPGYTVSPVSITLSPGQTEEISVTIDPAAGQGIGENQGYIIMDGLQHDAHMPVWARVIPAAPLADVLIIDNDGSGLDPDFGDYIDVYTSTLTALGKSYAIVDTAANFGAATTIPQPADLAGYKAVLWFTGDNYASAAGLTVQDQHWLLDYLNNGGAVIAMGQDLAATVGAAPASSTVWIYNWGLASTWLQDSISDGNPPAGFATSSPDIVPFFRNIIVKLTQLWVDEVTPSVDEYGRGGVAVLNYGGPFNVSNGTVAVAHRDRPTLEMPDLTYLGRAMYATFGLEGMAITPTVSFTPTTPVELLGAALLWAGSEPGTAALTDTTPISATGTTIFSAGYDAPEGSSADATGFRWDFGDGSPYVASLGPQASHTYLCSEDNVYTVRVEVIDMLGNAAIGSRDVDVSASCFDAPMTIQQFFLPFIGK